MIYACQNTTDKNSPVANNKYVFYIWWGQEVEFESHIAPFGCEARKKALSKLHSFVLLEIDWLISELREETSNLTETENAIIHSWWENILKRYRNINLKINLLLNYCYFPLKKQEKIHIMLDKAGNLFCCADVILNYTNDEFKLNKARFPDLVYCALIPALKNIRDLLSRDYALSV